MPQLKIQNYYTPTITAFTGALWDATFTLSVAPTYSYGYIVLAADNINLREIVYYHSVAWNIISVRAENRGLGGTTPKQHGTKENCAMKDVAEIFNFFSDNISQCFNIEKTGGLTVKVWWGTVFYNGEQVTVADTNLTLADNTTNYVKYSFPTNTISFDASNTGNIKAIISTLGGVITSITYKVAKESFIDFTVAITGALPPQAGNAGKFLQTDSTNVSWQSPSLPPNASTTVAGMVEISTDAEFILSSSVGWTGAFIVPTPSQVVWLVYYGDGSDGDATISVNTSLSKDMYYNNLTVNTGIVLDPAGYAIYVRGTLTLTGTAKIARDWNAASWQTAWAALATGTCWACLWGVTWWIVNGWNAPWVAVNPSYTNITSAAGWAWGSWFSGGWTGASASWTRWALYNTIRSLFSIMAILSSPGRALALPTSVYGWSPSSGGGGGGGAWNGGTFAPWVGGWSGWNWGNIFIYANILSGTWTISAVGWAWWNGAASTWSGWATPAGGGGGGSGWSGWFITFVYRSWSLFTFTLTGWAGWIGWAWPWAAGANWNTGTTGQSVVLQS